MAVRWTGQWRRAGLHAGWVAGAGFFLTLGAAAVAISGYEHARHPVAWLGAATSATAWWFNLLGFALPGLLLAAFGAGMQRSIEDARAGIGARLAANLLLISGLAFASLSLLPFAPGDADGPESRRHALAWTIALLAWLPATALIALAVPSFVRWRSIRAIAVVLGGAMLALLAVPAGAWPTRWQLTPAIMQRLVLLVYFAWPASVALILLHASRLRRRQ